MTTTERAGALEVPWIWAGMTMDDGLIDRPLQAGEWFGGLDVAVEDGRLMYRHIDVFSMRAGMLENFLALHDADDAAITSYAAEYGSLASPTTRETCMDARTEGLKPTGFFCWSESLEEWRLLARHFRAVVDLTAAVHLDQRVPDSTVASLNEWPMWKWEARPGDYMFPWREGRSYSVVSPLRRLTVLRAELPNAAIGRLQDIGVDNSDDAAPPLAVVDQIMNAWFDLAPSTIAFSWHPNPQVQIRPWSLLSALVLQLAYTAARKDGLAMCSECSRPYIPKRRPASGRNNYCPDCGIRAAWRNAQRKKKGGK